MNITIIIPDIIPDIEIWGELDEKICMLRESLNMALESLEETDREIDIELERQRWRERELIGNSISDYDRAITVMDRLYIDKLRQEAEIKIKRIIEIEDDIENIERERERF
jgi:hypothetical protein